MVRQRRLKRYCFGTLLVLMVCAVTEVATRSGWLDPLEHTYYDFWHQLAGKRFDAKHVAIVAVDDQTLLNHRDEPIAFWGPHFAKAIAVLRRVGVRIIGIDFLFLVSSESWLKGLEAPESDMSRTYDIPMRFQLNAGNVILTANVVENDLGETEILLPVTDYLFALPGGRSDVGLANFYTDDDTVVRRFVPRLFEADRLPNLSFAALLAQRTSDTDSPYVSQTLGTHNEPNASLPRPIGFVGPPGTIPRLSFGKLLAPEAHLDPQIKNLKNKVVIIGAEHAGNNDIHLTPYDQHFLNRASSMMSGAEVHANIVETLLTGRLPRPVSDRLRIMSLAGTVIIGIFLFFRLGPVQGLVCFFIMGLACSGAAYLFFLHNKILPVGNVHIGLGLSYIGSLGLRLTREERARSQLQRAVGPYVSEAVVGKLISSGKLPDLGGETLKVTVLFSDIRNFTAIAETLSPHEVVEMLNHYYRRVCEPILEQGGMVDKFIGDAVMAIFGAPISHPDQARRGLIAALDMVQIAQTFQDWLCQRFPDKHLPAFRVGIGVHTGEAVVGNIGFAKRMAYTAIGDTVNIASRLEGLSKQFGWSIVASQETLMAAGPDFAVGRMKKVQLSGRTGEIEVVEVLVGQKCLK